MVKYRKGMSGADSRALRRQIKNRYLDDLAIATLDIIGLIERFRVMTQVVGLD